MATAEQVKSRKAELPGLPVVSYINTTAAVKAESDICCTSSNAVKVVESQPEKELIFLPDRNLGSWVAEQTGKKLFLWPGFCTTHQKILPEHILPLKAQHPEAEILVHPECTPEVRAIADYIGSTSGILRRARDSAGQLFIIGTECGLLHTLKKENPTKTFLSPTTPAVCPNMKRIELETVLWSLEEMRYGIEVPEAVQAGAKRAIDRMLAIP
jgi:quinolinate synthase